MALRIGGGKQAPAEELQIEEAPAEEMPEEMPEEMEPEAEPTAEEAPAQGGGVLDQMTVNYLQPEMGPFSCGNCQFYGAAGPNSCSVVQGQIDEGGICNVFTPMMGEEQQEEAPEEMPMEELPEEEPVEEEV